MELVKTIIIAVASFLSVWVAMDRWHDATLIRAALEAGYTVENLEEQL